MFRSESACYYIYELTMQGKGTDWTGGLFFCGMIILNGVIKKHENTRKEKEEDRIRHVDVCSAPDGADFSGIPESK